MAGAFGVELPVRVVFEAPTIEAMARVLEKAERQPEARIKITAPRIGPSRAQRILDRLDALSDNEVEELLLELKDKELN